MKFAITLLLLLVLLIQGCMADIRTPLIKQEGITTANGDQLANHQTYSLKGRDVWKGLFGKLGKPWPQTDSELALRYAIGTFDSEVSFLNGDREGVQAGLQSWNYYEKAPGAAAVFMEYDERIAFGLSAYQYFFELLDRLKKAPIISYAGEKEFLGQIYDQVFVSWETPKPHQQHDQYVLWINQESGLLDFAVYTLRETYLKLPGAKAFYGSIQFADWRSVDGILIPHRQIVYLNEPKKKANKHLHQLEVREFAFDDFPLEDLYPNPKLEKIGDDKVVME